MNSTSDFQVAHNDESFHVNWVLFSAGMFVLSCVASTGGHEEGSQAPPSAK